MQADKMPFLQHLEELRKRMIICILAVCAGFAVSYMFKARLFDILAKPWIAALPRGQAIPKLIYTAPHEAFFTYLKVSFVAGLGLAIPVIIYQLWRFMAPGLYSKEKKYILPIVLFSTVFFITGTVFGYFLVLPVGFKFFASFADEYITPMISTREFLTFSVRMLFGFGLVFELPVFAFFLGKMGLISSDFLKRQRRYAIVLIFIAAAAISPSPDVLSQLMMAGPLLVLYEASVWIVHFFGAKNDEIVKEDEQADIA